MSLVYEVQIAGWELCGSEILSVRFTVPEGYAFRPGQWLRLTLPTTQGEITETFSISSAPRDPYLEITTRMSGSPFKRALDILKTGDAVRISAPGGHLTLGDDLRSVAFLIGGVGITPVRSMLRDAKSRGRSFADALLIYGNRDDSCVPFRDELMDMNDIGVRTVLVFETPPRGWEGEAGFISAEMVERYLDPLSDGRPFVVAGPPPMVAAMEKVMDQLSLPLERRKIERFGPAK